MSSYSPLNRIAKQNYNRMKFVSFIVLGFAVLALALHKLYVDVWTQNFPVTYLILDLILFVVGVFSLVFYWFIPSKNRKTRKNITQLLIFVLLIWSAVVTGVEFSTTGYSTYLLLLVVCSFFFYQELFTSVVFFGTSYIVLIGTLTVTDQFGPEAYPMLFIFIPFILVALLVSHKNFKLKIESFKSQDKLERMAKKLAHANSNLEEEVKARTQKLEQTNSELIVARDHAEEANALKTEILHNMSHEIRTPLNGIIGFSALLDSDDIDRRTQKTYLDVIRASADQLLQIIDSILEVSALRSFKNSLRSEKICLNEFLKAHSEPVEREAKTKGLSYLYNFALDDKSSYIRTDSRVLGKIIDNLLRNALKFTQKGSIETGYIIDDGKINLFVKDTGMGISKDFLPKVFDRFAQDKNVSSELGGLGLGLSIAESCATKLNSHIIVKSEKGQGTEFLVKTPFMPEQQKEKKLLVDASEGLPKFRKLHILVVEDEDINSFYFHTLLTLDNKNDHVIYHAKNGKDAVSICRENEDIDIVLMDIKMPVTNGLTATRMIKECRPELPVIIQTAYYSPENRKQAFAAGCDGFISKPVDGEELLKMIYEKA